MVGLVSHVTRCLGLHFRAGSTISCKVCAQFEETDLQNVLRFIVTLSCVYRKIDFDIDLQRTKKCRNLGPYNTPLKFPAPLKLRPYGAIQICLLLLLLFFCPPAQSL